MIVGVPKEIKTDEYRVAMMPVGVEELTRAGHQVLIEAGAGMGSGISDEQYAEHGAEIVADAADVWKRADLIVKVKEPLPRRVAAACGRARSSSPTSTSPPTKRLTRAVMKSGITAIAYETIKDARGTLPLLTPMSEVAGRMSIQEGAKFLERPFEGRGILLGGVPGVLPANVVILGGGIVGANAAKVAAGLGANVTILDINLDRLRYLDDVMPPNVTTLFSDRHNILDSLQPGRPGHRRRADPRRAGAAPGPPRRPEAHAAAGRHHRRGHRPGRLRRDVAADDAQQADVHRRRRRALLRDQHARRGRPHQHLRADQRDAAVRAAAGEQGLRQGGAREPGAGAGRERPRAAR